MFDSDSEDSNDGNTVCSTISTAGTTQDLEITIGTVDAAPLHNSDEDLSPSKKIKLTTKVSTSESSNLVKSKNRETQKAMSNDSEVVPNRNPRRSTRNQQMSKSAPKTDSVQARKDSKAIAKVKNSKVVTDGAATYNEVDLNQTPLSMTKSKSKRGRKKQTPVTSNLASTSIPSNFTVSNATNAEDLSNSDSDYSASNVIPKSLKPFNTSNTNTTKTSVQKVENISNRDSLKSHTSSSGAASFSSADIPKKNNLSQNTNTANSIQTSAVSTSKTTEKKPASTGNISKTSLGEFSGGTNASAVISENTKRKSFEESMRDLSDNKVEPCEEAPIVLTAAQRARIEQNRQKALLIRQERMNKFMPPLKKSEQLEKEGKKVLRVNDTKLVDTGGGFFLEEDDDFDKIPEADIIAALRRAEEPAPLVPEDRPSCSDCNNTFDSSYLLKHFDHPVCDDCRDNDSCHALITKTDARNEYLLQDVDLDKRDPPLRYIVRKNPHNDRWGDMKLYLKLQIEKRCMDVWGSEEALEEAIAKKAQQREVSKQKKFKKKMLELRMNVRSSLYTRASKSHEHEYGDEEYIEADDEYSRTCSTCGHSYRYDKM